MEELRGWVGAGRRWRAVGVLAMVAAAVAIGLSGAAARARIIHGLPDLTGEWLVATQP
jgi:hypothetical protein